MREGTVTVYYGPMFAEKTTRGLDHVDYASLAGIPFLAVRPQIDLQRYPHLQDHNGHRAVEALAVDRAEKILDNVRGVQLVFIDEGCLFDVGLVPTVSVLKKKGLDTVISTLDYYDTGKWFGLSQFANSGLPNYTVKDLLNLADVSELVQGKCAMPYGNRRTCDKPSRYTYSMEPKTSAVEVGKEKYCSFCDHHYALARNVGLQPWQKAALKIAASEYDIKHPDRTLRMIESPPRRAE